MGLHPTARDRHVGLRNSLFQWFNSNGVKKKQTNAIITDTLQRCRLPAAALQVARTLARQVSGATPEILNFRH